MTHCPCCSQKKYADCCERFISKKIAAPTPETLMRSRYTAYTQANIAYIVATMQPPASNDFDAADATHWASAVKWMKLEVLHSEEDDDEGLVEFIAHFVLNGSHQTLHEVSIFKREDEQWFYVDAEEPDTHKVTKLTRNDPCLCGSGTKFKKCCAI